MMLHGDTRSPNTKGIQKVVGCDTVDYWAL